MIGRLREALAAAVGAGEQVALTAAGTEGTDAAALRVLREQIAGAAALLGEREPAEEALRQRLAVLTAATDAVRGTLQAAASASAPPPAGAALAEPAPATPPQPAPAEKEAAPPAEGLP